MLGAVVAGRFKVERKAGSGGMGTVYRAHDLLQGQPVALKVLTSDEVRDAERFVQEAGIVARLNHPAIVRYVAHGSTDGQHYFAMEWLEGIDLDTHIDRQPLGLHDCLRVVRRTLQALQHAHEQGIVHRDIKPANLFLPGGDIGALKLLDFGVARLTRVDRRLTQTGVMIGTPGYLAPEIISGAREVDARTDLYAVGCVAFRCLTGRLPFEAGDAGALLAKIIMEEPAPLRELAPAVPPPVAALVHRLLLKDPDERPRDTAEALAALDALAEVADQAADYRRRRTAVSLTFSERRLCCLVVIGPPAPGATPRSAEPFAAVDDLKRRFGAGVHARGDGHLVVTLPSGGKSTDLAARAARAALALRRELPGRPLAICCGQAPAGDSLADLDEVVQQGVALLARTPPERIRVAGVVMALVEGRFEVVRDGEGGLLETERELFDARRHLLGKTTEFVGRSREIGSLLGALSACVDEGAAQALLALGPAGIGKSRLLQEFLQGARKQAPDVKVVLGVGDALAAGSPFGILARALRRHAGVLDGEPVEDSRRKLTLALGAHLGGDDLNRVAAFLGELARVEFPDGHHPSLRAARSNPQLMGDQIRRAFEDWLKAETEAQPVLLVLEDLHWGDSGTVGLIDSALRNLREQALMVLALARPEVRASFPDLWEGRGLSVIELAPLARKAAEKLVKEALGPDIPTALLAQMVARAEGNPFYLEELIRAARDGRTERLPETVLGMVHARLDAEGEEAKRLLRAASVFGEHFSRGGLAALLGGEAELAGLLEWLQRLVDRELVRRGGLPEGAEGEFAFAHNLVREAAYSTLTEGDRVLGHGLAGDHLAAVGCPDAMVLAEHYRRGQQLARSAHWYRQAADQALRACDLAGALARAELGLAAYQALDTAGRAEIAPETPGALCLAQAEAHLWRAEFAPAGERGGHAVAALLRGGPLWYRAVAQTLIAVAKQGKIDEVLRWVDEACGAAPAPDAGNMQVVCLAWATSFLLVASKQKEADALMERIAGIVPALAEPDPQALALVQQAQAARASLLGQPAACLAALEAAQAAFQQAGDARNASAVRANVGFMLAEHGAWDRAEEQLRAALADAERMGLAEQRAVVLHNLGRVVAVRGDLAAGERLEREALDSFIAQGEPRLEGIARLYLGDIKRLAGDAAEAEAEAARAVRVLAGAPASQVAARALLARALHAQGRTAEALEAARQAADDLAVLGSIDEGEADVRLVHAECLWAAGLAEQARQVIARAHARLVERADSISDPALRARFLSGIAAHTRTMELAAAWTDAAREGRGGRAADAA